MQNKIQKCIDNAEAGVSKLTPPLLAYEGMSSSKVRHFLNNLQTEFPNKNYLEIGIWRGTTFTSSLFKNKFKSALGIDNFSQWGENGQVKIDMFEKLEKHLNYSKSKNIEFIEDDYKKVDYTKFEKFDIYFYDGNHSFAEQYNAFTVLDPYLSDTFICMVDDWNYKDAELGTRYAFKLLNYNVIKEWIMSADFDGDLDKWWNGFYIAIIEKGKKL